MALGIHVRTRLLEERLLPQHEPGTLGARGGVVIVAIPVEDGGAVTAHGCVAVEGEQHVTLSAELTYETLGLAPLTIQLDVLGEERVGLGERAAQAARVGIQEVLD